MKFGDAFMEYLRGEDRERFLDKCSHVEYKRLKKVLKSCRRCRRSMQDSGAPTPTTTPIEEDDDDQSSHLRQFESCHLCDEMFFSELAKEVSEIAGCFRSRVRRLHLHVSSGLHRCMLRLRHCFMDDQEVMIQQGRMLIEYVTMNATAIQKILKKYDKVHSSVNGRNCKTMMRAIHIELLQSPWLIELGAFYISFCGSSGGESSQIFRHFSCDLSGTCPAMTLTLSDSVVLEYSLTCPICLDTVFNPYALSCGHLFCNGCACSAASVLLFQGPKTAPPESKCPICKARREHPRQAVRIRQVAALQP